MKRNGGGYFAVPNGTAYNKKRKLDALVRLGKKTRNLGAKEWCMRRLQRRWPRLNRL